MTDEKSNKSRNRSFTNMLTNTLRNHYTLNQMVDRKARILLSINVVILSFIIGRIIGNNLQYDFKFFVIICASIFCLISIIYSVLAIMPDNKKKQLTEQALKTGEMNPLHFGNYLNMSSDSYENSMMEMSEDMDFPHRSMLKEIYHVGTLLERKRKFLKYSLTIMSVGICLSLILSIVFKIFMGSL